MEEDHFIVRRGSLCAVRHDHPGQAQFWIALEDLAPDKRGSWSRDGAFFIAWMFGSASRPRSRRFRITDSRAVKCTEVVVR